MPLYLSFRLYILYAVNEHHILEGIWKEIQSDVRIERYIITDKGAVSQDGSCDIQGCNHVDHSDELQYI